ncbi:MAG: 2-C-methyl-D-erythritol 4-phosphate cytidylyltransferase [Acidobacteriota bacterium]|jgi:2-C-methyl-D-erythritol 4-phosphate cytidylyltransferase|nr:2-C-methyl-D-erythritol 4-phosphate cytidylyltransferase [Acidobacteriota bacterium]
MNVAIIVAAGRGSRAGGAQAKQFRDISGIPLIIHTLSRFERSETIAESVVVLPCGGAREGFLTLAGRHGLRKVSRTVEGGETRAESVRRGLQALGGEGVGVVAVHDGVRPFITPEEIDRTVREAERSGAAILAAPAVETIKEAADGRVLRTLERARLWHAQTPQCFRYELLRRAYEQAPALGADVTDCSALVERLGESIRIVEGGAHNIKITTPRDFALAEILLKSGQ